MRQRITIEVDYEPDAWTSEPAKWAWTEIIDAPALVVDFGKPFDPEIDPMPDPAWSDTGRGDGCNGI